ncbi:MAG: 50S ribosomal protein L23 [Candidatus Diapherotrites archaeon]|uniref:Large ribosomal subunit protein uL23 n=1 Tax=Candidatus Iainarchaeum sp. TaxID=3101447 RepID=A0A939C9N8_9ARCH|nr:50S ribosomal protein L23 [Candidatus Diapherotrites archaeon]
MKQKETKTGLAGFQVILYPLISEKAVNMIERENKMSFIVNKKATKADVKQNIEKQYNVKVDAVKVLNDRKGRKRAIVKINKQFKADAIATKLGVV